MRFLPAIAWLALVAGSTRLTAQDQLPDGLYAEFTTPPGVFIAELHYREAPLTVTNFVGLTEGTLGPKAAQPWYTGLKWYRVVPGFVIQSGNPKAPEDADPGYSFPDEFDPGLRHGETGILSMANGGPDTNSAEDFVTLGDCTRLNYLHSVFGRVVRGRDVLPRIKANDAFSIKVLRVGARAQAFRADIDAFQALAAKARKYSGATEPGPAAHFADPDKLLPVDPPRAQNFNYKLANLERFTGVKIVARMFSQSPTAEEDKVPGAYMRALAEKLGVAQSGVLAAYFADEKDWRVWIGDDLTATFLGRPATPADLADGAALHEAKEAFFAAATKQAAVYTVQARASRGPDRPLLPADLVKYSTDAILDALLLRFEPARTP